MQIAARAGIQEYPGGKTRKKRPGTASAAAYTAQLTFNWRADTITGKSTTSVQLKPYETVMVDVAALQANGTIPASAQWPYVSIAAPIKPDELLAGLLAWRSDWGSFYLRHWVASICPVLVLVDTLPNPGVSRHHRLFLPDPRSNIWRTKKCLHCSHEQHE
jgi:hypothetical protein